MKTQSMRSWLDCLKEENLLKSVTREVDPEYELSAVAKKLDGLAAVRFENVRGHQMPVVVNLCGSRELFAKALGTDVLGMIPKFIGDLSRPKPCREVPKAQAPVKQNVIIENIDLLDMFPIPIHHEKDGGKYITAGVLIARNPETGARNLSIHRLQVTGKNRLGILILPRHLSHFFQIAERAGHPLEVAIAIGLDPVTLLASQAITPLGVDEMEIASALRGEALEVVKCETVDLEVPAHAEIVLEGRLLPNIREEEGPFGEYPKYYGPAGMKPVIEVTAVTHRDDPIYQTILPASKEHILLGGIPREATLFQLVQQIVPTVQAVNLTLGGTCRYHAVISIDKRHEGEGKNAIFAAFTSSQEVKHVVVVDKDVDVFNMEEVEWAIATRCQADKDVFIVPGTLASKLDPSTEDGIGAKMGIDATCPLNAPPGRFERIKIPNYDRIKLEDYLG